VFGVLGTVVGARIGVRDAHRRWTAERRDAHRTAARSAALELAEASYSWSSAHLTYGASQLGIRGPNTPPASELSDNLGAAVLRQRIAYAALYTSVGKGPIHDAAQALEVAQKPFQQYLEEQAHGVLDGEEAAIKTARGRLLFGSANYREALEAFVSAIAPALVPEVDR